MAALLAVLGASGALAVREFVEWRMRVRAKRAACIHRYTTSTFYAGLETRRCSECGHQWPVKPRDPI